MLKSILTICILSFSCTALSDDHSNASSIEYKQSFFGTKYFKADAPDKFLNRRNLRQLLQSNPEALAEFNKSNAPFIISQGLAILGGVMIGAPLGSAMASDEDVNYGVVAGGIGVVAIGLLFEGRSQKHIRLGTDIYNSSLLSLHQTTPTPQQVKARLFLSSSSVGFSVHF